MSLLKMNSTVHISRRLMGELHHNRTKYWLERIGTREMVGFGHNGTPSYVDRPDFPFPAVRYKETTPEIQALYEKQKGDWKLLSRAEKKMLYRSNFGQTFAEFNAPLGEWMLVVGYGLMTCCAGIWIFIFFKKCVYPEFPDTFKLSSCRAQMRRMIDMQAEPIQGLCSNWDYENEDWKVKKWNTPVNPFIKCAADKYALHD